VGSGVGVGGVLPGGTLHCDAKSYFLVSTYDAPQHPHLCFDFSCNIRVYEPYPVVQNDNGGVRVAAGLRTAGLQRVKKSQTLDIVKCTGFYCFAGFCFVFIGVFIKVIFHLAAFPPVVRFFARRIFYFF